MEGESAETVIPLIEEHLRIAKRRQETGRIRVAVTTAAETRLVEEVLRDRHVEIERVPVDRPVSEVPPIREEGDTLVIPVLEEVLVVERRLVVREEVRLRLRNEERREAMPVTLRRQQASVERLPPMASPQAHQRQEANGMRTITGLFDSRPDAERAVEYMVQHYDIDRNAVQVHAAGPENATAGTHERRSESHHGFVASLDALGLPEADHVTYAEGLRRGGILVSVRAPEDKLDKVAHAFEENGAVDLDEREREWRTGGWQAGGPTGGPTGGLEASRQAAAEREGRHGDWPGGFTGGPGRLVDGTGPGGTAAPGGGPAVNPDAASGGWTGGGGAIGSTAATAEGSDPNGPRSTYAGTSYIGARATDEDITRPVNAGIASAPAVRPAGPAALAAASAGASTAALRGSEADARRASHEGFEGPGSGEGPAPGSAAAGEQPVPSREGPHTPATHGTGTAATQGLASGTPRPSDALQAGREGLRTDAGPGRRQAQGGQDRLGAMATPAGGATGMGAPSGSATGTAGAQGRAAQPGGTGGMAADAGSPTPQTTRGHAAGRTAPMPATDAAGRDEAIPVVEERLNVGKRDVSHGRVRVRSYIAETPVEEQVRLREEQVRVERRPVDRPLGAGETARFEDRVIEATESAEEAVLDKEARVREEVVIRKDATERTETVSDTVRRTEVAVEDERRRAAGTPPPPRDPAR